MGGGDVIGQALDKGLVDEFRIHLAPLVLGGGAPRPAWKVKRNAARTSRISHADGRPSEQLPLHIAYDAVNRTTSVNH